MTFVYFLQCCGGEEGEGGRVMLVTTDLMHPVPVTKGIKGH